LDFNQIIEEFETHLKNIEMGIEEWKNYVPVYGTGK
jgi:hypothetical protein